MHFFSALFIATSLLTATQAFATDTGNDESSTLDYFIGDWRCGVQKADGVLDPTGFATASTDVLRGGWYATWILAFHDDTSDKMLATMRYDAARKEYVLFLKDDNGSYGMGISKGWDVHALSFEGTLHKADGKDIGFTKTFTVLDDGKFSLGCQFEGEDAKPSLVCQK